MAIEALLVGCNDSNSDIRMNSDEALNRLIKVSSLHAFAIITSQNSFVGVVNAFGLKECNGQTPWACTS
jgi:hypothetical protein